jgi:hypothetical protein
MKWHLLASTSLALLLGTHLVFAQPPDVLAHARGVAQQRVEGKIPTIKEPQGQQIRRGLISKTVYKFTGPNLAKLDQLQKKGTPYRGNDIYLGEKTHNVDLPGVHVDEVAKVTEQPGGGYLKTAQDKLKFLKFERTKTRVLTRTVDEKTGETQTENTEITKGFLGGEAFRTTVGKTEGNWSTATTVEGRRRKDGRIVVKEAKVIETAKANFDAISRAPAATPRGAHPTLP